MTFARVGTSGGLPVHALAVGGPADWPAALPEGVAPFVLLLVWDARDVPADAIGDLMERLLDQGMVYLCAWGAGCERVHDVCDEVEVDRQVVREMPETWLMTTWHDGWSLEETVGFFLASARPDQLAAAPASRIAATIGPPDLAARVEAALRRACGVRA